MTAVKRKSLQINKLKRKLCLASRKNQHKA